LTWVKTGRNLMRMYPDAEVVATVPEGVADQSWQTLRSCRAWSAASDDAVARLAEQSTAKTFAEREMLLAEGSAAHRFGVVSTGSARVFHLAADGRRITYESLGPSDPFGMVAALAGSRNPAHVEALSDGDAVWVPREALLVMFESENAVAKVLLQDLAGRVVDFTSMVQTLSLDVPARVASYLFQRSLAVGEPGDEGLVVELGMRKADLAEALGTVPESLSRAFGRMRDEGIIEVRGSTVLVHDVGALARLGSGYTEG